MNIFLSYLKRDLLEAMDLCSRLESIGFKVWIADREIAMGDNLNQKIEEGMRASDFIVIFSRSSSFSSPDIMFELGMAYALRKRVIPVIIEDGGNGDIIQAFSDIVHIRVNSFDEAMPKLEALKRLKK